VIRVNELRKTFNTQEGGVYAIDGIDFEVPRGKFFTLLGSSGCGKSTTLRSIAGLERPDNGEIRIAETTVFSSAKRVYVPTNKRSIGMVFQSYAIWPHMTVEENVAYPLRVKRVPRAEVRARVEEALEIVGLDGMGSRPAPRLSGGQQQRVALARALVAAPEVLLLDEPLSNLDAKLRAHMRVELKRLQSQIGITTIYVTHDQAEALAMSDEIAVMSHGKIMQCGTPDEIYHSPRNQFTAEFIGSTNLIECKMGGDRLAHGINKVETSLGPMLANLDKEASIPSGRVAVSIRPEVIAMHRRSDGGAVEGKNVFQGRVEQLVFLGESLDCDIRVGESLLRVKGVSVRRPAVGEEVVLQMPPEHCVLVAADEQASAGVAPDQEIAGTLAAAGV
jgi:iron(III) transport system ATP-binding protein